jgi:hypothetical protein
MAVKALLDLQTTDSGCGSIRIASTAVELILEYEYHREGQTRIGRLRFKSSWAYRFHDEFHFLGFPEGAYDAVVEIEPSIWLQEHFDTKGGKRHRENRGERHLAVFLSNNGLLEVMAKEVIREPDLGSFSVQL